MSGENLRMNGSGAVPLGSAPDAGTMGSISVVIPVYNSEGSLRPLIGRLHPVLRALTPTFEVILVNDGSRDRSWEVVRELAAEYQFVRGMTMMRNYGQHNALLCGIRAASGEVIVTMDDDLQHPPEEIPKLLDTMAGGYDVVYGVANELPHGFVRNMLSRGIKRMLSRAMGIKNIRDISAFRAFRADIRRAFDTYQSPSLLLDVLLSWGTTRFGSAVVRHDVREIGKSNYTFTKLFNQTMLILTGFSTEPLRIASMVGFGFTVFGIGVFIYVVTNWVLYGSVPGFPFLAAIISLFSGAQLFALGILGEYLARVFHRTTERPTYVVRESVEHEQGRLTGSVRIDGAIAVAETTEAAAASAGTHLQAATPIRRA